MLLGNQNNQVYNTNDINIIQIFQILQKEKRWLTIHHSITITICSNNNFMYLFTSFTTRNLRSYKIQMLVNVLNTYRPESCLRLCIVQTDKLCKRHDYYYFPQYTDLQLSK